MTEIKQYLTDRKVLDSRYIDFVTTDNLNENEFRLFTVNGQQYMLSHFLDSSDKTGYGLVKTNHVLKTEKNDMVAIAVVEGDDIICFNTNDSSIWLWRLQTGDGELAKITNSFKEFELLVV